MSHSTIASRRFPGLGVCALGFALALWPARADLLVSSFSGHRVLRYGESNGAPLSLENNVIELSTKKLSTTGYGASSGLPISGYSYFPPEFSVRDVVVRKNLVRSVDDAPSEYTRAIEVSFCERGRLENNIISLFNTDPYFNPILHRPLQSVRTFHNVKPDGTLVRSQLYDPPYAFAADVVTDVEQRIDDAFLTAFLKL